MIQQDKEWNQIVIFGMGWVLNFTVKVSRPILILFFFFNNIYLNQKYNQHSMAMEI